MAKGRKRKPTALKLIQGTARADRQVEQEAELPEVDAIDLTPPDSLKDFAVIAWEFYAPILRDSKVLTKGDLHNLEAFCENYRLWRDAVEMYQNEGITVETPQGGLKKHPAVIVANDAQAKMISFGALLGLDPSSRTKINVGTDGGKPKGNPFASL